MIEWIRARYKQKGFLRYITGVFKSAFSGIDDTAAVTVNPQLNIKGLYKAVARSNYFKAVDNTRFFDAVTKERYFKAK